MQASLAGELAVVTGAASAHGIGRAVAALFAEQGARVAVLDVDGEGATSVATALGAEHRGYRCDISSAAEVEQTFARLGDEMGDVSVLVNNAGIARATRLEDIAEVEYELVVGVNLKGTFLCCQAALGPMRRRGGGSIVNLASVAAERGGGLFSGPHYSAAKGGVIGLTRALARDLAPDGIRVNAVAPGFVDTEIFGGRLPADRQAALVREIPLARAGMPEDVARCCLFLAADMSSYVTGEILDVNGGLHIG